MSDSRTADLSFSTARFRAEREADWEEFDRLLTRLEKGSARALTDEELLRLPALYRATLSSLSIARATSLDRAMLDYLEGLSLRGYFLLYGVRESTGARIGKFFREDWPRAGFSSQPQPTAHLVPLAHSQCTTPIDRPAMPSHLCSR